MDVLHEPCPADKPARPAGPALLTCPLGWPASTSVPALCDHSDRILTNPAMRCAQDAEAADGRLLQPLLGALAPLEPHEVTPSACSASLRPVEHISNRSLAAVPSYHVQCLSNLHSRWCYRRTRCKAWSSRRTLGAAIGRHLQPCRRTSQDTVSTVAKCHGPALAAPEEPLSVGAHA